MEDFLLAVEPNYSVKQYLRAIEDKSTESKLEISIFLKDRFLQRYIDPGKSECKNGFNILANCCLLIETLESFYRGWDKTPRYEAKNAFNAFFNRFPEFQGFQEKKISDSFYENIRCGILHQGETKAGWRISRNPDHPLLDTKAQIINANRFRDTLEIIIKKYCDNLNALSTDSDEWKMLEKKMSHVLKNCKQ